MDAAEALIDDIRAMKQRVPNFVIPESKAARARLNRAASVPPQFVDITAMAIRNNEELTRGGNSPGLAEIRDRMSYADAFNLVADEMEAMTLFVRHSVAVARNEAGSIALTTYALPKRLAKRPETAGLAPHVENMRSALGARGRGRKAKAKAKSKAAPAPANPGTSPAPAPATPATSPAPAEPSPVTASSPATEPKKQ